MSVIFVFAGFFIFIFGIVFLSDRFSPTTLSSKAINSSPLLLFLFGIFFTALCQSSSATGIVVLLLHDKRILTLKQTAMFLIGGNLGTTISGQIFSFSTGDLIPSLIILTIIFRFLMQKIDRLIPVFNFFVSFSCIIFGLNLLKNAANYYSSSLMDFFQMIDSGLGAFVFGCLTTAVFQSSSLVIGILVVLVEGNILTIKEALLAAFGVNVGTCSTLLLVGTGLGVNGKRGALFQFIFNIIGVIIFTLLLPYFMIIVDNTASSQARVLANAHTLFNLKTALMLIIFWNKIEKFVFWLYPSNKYL